MFYVVIFNEILVSVPGTRLSISLIFYHWPCRSGSANLYHTVIRLIVNLSVPTQSKMRKHAHWHSEAIKKFSKICFRWRPEHTILKVSSVTCFLFIQTVTRIMRVAVKSQPYKTRTQSFHHDLKMPKLPTTSKSEITAYIAEFPYEFQKTATGELFCKLCATTVSYDRRSSVLKYS